MKLISADTIPIKVRVVDEEPWESFEKAFLARQKPLDADIAEIVDNNFSKLFLDDADDYVVPKIIKLADLKEVINDIDMGRITMSKGAEILNKVAVDFYKEKTKMSIITNNSIG